MTTFLLRKVKATGTALGAGTLALLLAGCDDRLDGAPQPNPYADEDAAAAADRAAATAPGSAPGAANAPAEEVIYTDAGEEEEIEADLEDWFDDGPIDTSGFDPTPMDDGRGFDPSPQNFDDFADPDDEGFE